MKLMSKGAAKGTEATVLEQLEELQNQIDNLK